MSYALSPLLWLVIYDPMLTRINRIHKGFANPTAGRIGMAAMAFADDLTLMAPSRATLQNTASDVAEWCRLVGITANRSKTAHIAYGTTEGTPRAPSVWGSGETAEPICNVWPATRPIRILGNYLTPDGSAKEMTLLAHGRVDTLLRIVRRRYITVRMAQYVVRTIIIPVLECCPLGIPLTEDELQKVCTPVMRMLRRGYTVHASFPSAYFHHHLGARVTLLVTRYDGMPISAHRRPMNGDGAPCFATLAAVLHGATADALQFPGDVLAFPNHAAMITPRRNGPRNTLLHLAHRLARRGIALREPRKADDRPRAILELQPLPEQSFPYASLHKIGWRNIVDAVVPFPEPLWGRAPRLTERRYTVRNCRSTNTIAFVYMRDVTRRASGLHNAPPPTPADTANKDTILKAMSAIPAATASTSPPFELAKLRELLWTPEMATATTACNTITVHADGSLAVVGGRPSMTFAAGIACGWQDGRTADFVISGMAQGSRAEPMMGHIAFGMSISDLSDFLVKCLAAMNQLSLMTSSLLLKTP